MLIKFTVGNFLSYKEKNTFSFEANNDKEIEEAVFKKREIKHKKFVKTAAIYGLNASGKSGLISAIRFFRDFVNQGLFPGEESSSGKIPTRPFLLNEENEKLPSFFEVELLIDKEIFVYGFEVFAKEIHREWLIRTPGKKEFFTREKQIFNINRKGGYREGPSEIKKITREDVLLLSNLAKFNGELARKIVAEITKIEILTSPTPDEIKHKLQVFAVKSYTDNSDYKRIVDHFILGADFGINAIRTEYGHIPSEELTRNAPEAIRELIQKSSPAQFFQSRVSFAHSKFDKNDKEIGSALFDSLAESSGTQKIFILSALFAKVIIEGGILIIDELDGALHPLICRFILHCVNSKEMNPKNSQLLFTTHDVSLLDKEFLRRDQIWFVDKNRLGASELFSLKDFGERSDISNYSKRYLEGRYGAIPYIKDLEGAK